LVRVAIMNFNLQTVREGLVRHTWTDAQLAELDQYLASLNLLAEWKHSMRGERACNIGSLDYLRRVGSLNLDHFFEAAAPARKTISVVLSGLFYQNMLSLSEMEAKYVLPSVDENARRIFPELAESGERAAQEIHDHPFRHPYQIIVALFMPAIAKASSRAAQGQSFVDEARLAIALERFRRANGHLPDALDSLTPQFIGKIPADVMDGQPLRYHKTGDDKFVLYSIGWNLKDDGGVIGRKPKGKGIDTLSGDWVWFSYTNEFKLE